MKHEDLTIKELLKLYPKGFTISSNGNILKTIFASSHFAAIVENHPLPPSNGGYLVVEMVETDSEGK